MITRVSVPEIQSTILNPILYQIVNDINNSMGMLTDPYISINSEDKILKTTRGKGTLGSNGPGNLTGVNETLTKGFVITSVEHKLAEERQNSLLMLVPDTNPILKDVDIDFIAKPIYHRMNLNLNIDFIHVSKDYLNMVLNNIRGNIIRNGLFVAHNLEYNYTIPKYLKYLLLNFLSCKNKRHPDGEKLSFRNYLDLICYNNLTIRTGTTTTIEDVNLAIKERQTNIFGTLNEDISQSEIEPNEEQGGYKISFSYELEYDLPASIYLEYPIMVYNTLIHKNFRTPAKQYAYPLHNNTRPSEFITLSGLKYNKNPMEYNIPNIIKVPSMDDNIREDLPRAFSRVFTYLFKVDDVDRKAIFNFKEDEDLQFKDHFKDFIIGSERLYIGTKYKSMIYFVLYENGCLDTKRKVLLDENGELRTDIDMDIMKTYRLVGYILRDLDYIPADDVKRISKYLIEENKIKTKLFYSGMEKYGYLRNTSNKYKGDDLYLIKAMEVRNKYLSTFDTFVDYYQLKDEDVNKLLAQYQDPYQILLKLTKYQNQVNKLKEITSTTVIRKDG